MSWEISKEQLLKKSQKSVAADLDIHKTKLSRTCKHKKKQNE